MAYSIWFTDQDDGKFLLIDADGYVSMECCCRPCLGVPDGDQPDDESCPCYGMGTADAPILLEIITDCDSCFGEHRLWLCWVSSRNVDGTITCEWAGGDPGDTVEDGECFWQLTCIIIPGDNTYWYLAIYDYPDAGNNNTGQAYYGTYTGTWDCDSTLGPFDGSGMTDLWYSCHTASASVEVFDWLVPT